MSVFSNKRKEILSGNAKIQEACVEQRVRTDAYRPFATAGRATPLQANSTSAAQGAKVRRLAQRNSDSREFTPLQMSADRCSTTNSRHMTARPVSISAFVARPMLRMWLLDQLRSTVCAAASTAAETVARLVLRQLSRDVIST
jgi:hypothetical protein